MEENIGKYWKPLAELDLQWWRTVWKAPTTNTTSFPLGYM